VNFIVIIYQKDHLFMNGIIIYQNIYTAIHITNIFVIIYFCIKKVKT